MTFLPIVDRELRVLARRPHTYWTRFAAGLAVLLVWAIINFTARSYARPADLSQSLFIAMCVIGFGFALLSGVFLTADCLSMEKREGTLGLLFLTDLRGRDVVLGKLAATSLNSIYALLTIFPVMALSLLLGGVTAAEFARHVLVMVTTLYLSLTLGLLASALSREAQPAMVFTFAGMLVLAGLVPVIVWFLDVLKVCKVENNVLNFISPVAAFVWAFDSNWSGANRSMWFLGIVATQFCLGLLFLVLACRLLPRRWQAKEEAPRPVAPRMQGHADSVAERKLGPRWRTRCPVEQPFLWLATRANRSRQVICWTALGLFLCWLVFYALAFRPLTQDFGMIVSVFSGYVLHLVFKGLLAMEATRQFSVDRASGALEIVLATPLSEKAITDGQRVAWTRAAGFLLTLAVMVNLGLLFMVNSGLVKHMGGSDKPIFNQLFSGGIIIFLADVWALQWVGMKQALLRRRHHWAALATAGQVLLPPCLGLLLFVFLSANNAINSDRVVMRLFWVWLGASVVLDLIVGLRARRRLQTGFRRMVAGEGTRLC